MRTLNSGIFILAKTFLSNTTDISLHSSQTFSIFFSTSGLHPHLGVPEYLNEAICGISV